MSIPSLRKQHLEDVLEIIRKKRQDMELEFLRALQEAKNKSGENKKTGDKDAVNI